jgi:Ca-activated chloride channel family protein
MTEANLTTKLNRPYLPPIGNDTEITGRITIEPGMQTTTAERQIAIVVDTSGSMSGDRMKTARDGAKRALGYLEDNDILTIIGFNSQASVVLEATRYGDITRDQIMSAIDDLTAGGGTDIHGGLKLATDELRNISSSNNTARRILLLSDGKDNVREAEDFERQARDIDEHGIRIRAGGIGDGYDEETIRTLGITARGQWSHIEEPTEIEEFFGQAVEEASTVVGANAELRMDIAEGVEFSKVYRSLPQIQEIEAEYSASNVAVVKLPDLLERDTQKVLMKIRVPGQTTEEKVTLADITLNAGSKTATGKLEVEFTDDGDLLSTDNKEVSIELDETRVGLELGRGNVEKAETRVEKMENKHGDSVDSDKLNDSVTVVKEGGRAEQENATKIKFDDDPV